MLAAFTISSMSSFVRTRRVKVEAIMRIITVVGGNVYIDSEKTLKRRTGNDFDIGCGG